MSTIWSEEEQNLLKTVRQYLSTREINKLFTLLNYERSTTAIQKQAKKFNLIFNDFGEVPANVFDSLDEKIKDALKIVLQERNQILSFIEPPKIITSNEKGSLTKQQKQILHSLKDQLEEIRVETERRGSISFKRSKSKNKYSLVLLLSDWHFCLQVKDPIDGTYLYNQQIATNRINSIPNKILSSIPSNIIKQCDEIVLVLAGDMVSGEGIFHGQEWVTEEHVVNQVIVLTKLIWNMLCNFSDIFPYVRVVTTRGNHGRTSGSPESNWDNILYQILELIIDMNYEKRSNISINNRYGEYNTFEIKGWKSIVRHHAPVQADTATGIAKFASWFMMHEWDLFCFLPKTKIILSNGIQKNIEELSISDQLFDEKGNVVIQKIHPTRNINENIFQFQVEKLPQELIPGVTAEHPFFGIQNAKCHLASRKDKRCHLEMQTPSYPCSKCKQKPKLDPKWIQARDLKKGDFIAIPFQKIPDQPLPYSNELCKLLGYYLAEGHIDKDCRNKPCKGNYRGVTWSFNKNEEYHHSEVERLVEKLFNLKIHAYKQKNSEEIQLKAHGSWIAEFFAKSGGEHSSSKVINNWIWQTGYTDRIDLISRWLFGDGSYRTEGTKSSRIQGNTASPNLASQIFLLALSLGLKPSYKISHIELKKSNSYIKGNLVQAKYPSNIISFYSKSASILMKHMGLEVQNATREKVNNFFYNDLFYVRINDISEVQYSGPVYNIATSTEHYTAGHLLTHNCFAHYHHCGIMTLCGKKLFRNGSLVGGDDYAESLAKYDSPSQLCWCVTEEDTAAFINIINF